MANYYAPGVYVEEKSSGNKPIAGVSTSVAIFIGVARKGQINTPTFISNFSEFQKLFGGPYRIIRGIQEHYLYYSVKHFFEQGGGKCYVIRVAHYKDINDVNTLQAISSSVSFDGMVGEQGKGLFEYDGANWVKTNRVAVNNINSILIESTNIYIGTDNGVFMSADAGVNWTPVNLGLKTKDIRSLIIDGTGPLYVGTAKGVYRKLDTNSFWEEFGSDRPGKTVNSLAIKGSEIFAANDSGVYRIPTDASLPWVEDGLQDISVSSLVLNNGVLYAASATGVYSASNTNPTTWTPINTNLGNISVHSLITDSNNLYAGTAGGVYKLSDGEIIWTDMSDNLADSSVKVLTIDAATTTLYAGTLHGVYKRATGDTLWSDISSVALESKNIHSLGFKDSTLYAGTSTTTIKNALTVSGINPGKWGDDLKAQVLSTSKYFTLLAEDVIAGSAIEHILLNENSDVQVGSMLWLVDEVVGTIGQVIDNELSKQTIQSITGDTTTKNIYVSSQNGAYERNLGENKWHQDVLSDLKNVSVNTSLHDTTNIYVGTDNGVYKKSLSGGSQWLVCGTGLDKKIHSLALKGTDLLAGTDAGIYILDLSVTDPVWAAEGLAGEKTLSLLENTNNLYASTDEGVYEKLDGSTTWSEKTGGEVIKNARVIIFNTDVNIVNTDLFVGTDKGVYRYDTLLSQWVSHITDPSDLNDVINSDPKNKNVHTLLQKGNALFAGTEGGLISRVDPNTVWTNVNISNKPLKIKSLADIDNILYAGTDRGLYYSFDSGATWQASNDGTKEVTINGALTRGVDSNSEPISYSGPINSGTTIFGSELEYLGETKLAAPINVTNGVVSNSIRVNHLKKIDGSQLRAGDPITFALVDEYIIVNKLSASTDPNNKGTFVHFTPRSLPDLPANSTKSYARDFMLLVGQGDEIAEIHENLSLVDLNQSDHVNLRLGSDSGGSIYISITDSPDIVDNVRLINSDFISLYGGNDGLSGINDTDILGSELTKTGLHALDVIKDASILCLPNASENVTSGAIGYCDNRKDLIYIIDHPSSTSDDIREYTAKFSTTYAALYYPWVKVTDATTGRKASVPSSGAVAGIFAKTDVKRGVHKAPAGLDTGKVTIAMGLDEVISKAEYDLLYQEKINAIRKLPSGFHVWGTRTLSADAEWKYVNVRRLFIFLEQSIERGTQWVTFEPNDRTLWKSIERNIKAFLKIQWLEGKLVGATEDEAFFVRCNEETNPQEVVDAGQVITLIGVAPSKPAEFVIFRIKQKAASS